MKNLSQKITPVCFYTYSFDDMLKENIAIMVEYHFVEKHNGRFYLVDRFGQITSKKELYELNSDKKNILDKLFDLK